ncbi:MAG: site-specific DNA-methyltransferase [Candidatus Omnitrophica bacterium]|nr:site-specific DNA-methyltransferase [Candidatus Omnitrophota bacterium]
MKTIYSLPKERFKAHKTKSSFTVEKSAKKSYQNWSKGELIKEIERLKKRKKYGLVWEDKPEEVVEMCKNKLPVVKEIKNKQIITNKNKAVNLLIDGDNYNSLSVLNYTHAGKVDVIYIDPPYNTGNKDFKYNDRYVDLEDGYRHSKWLSFMEKRLKLAKNLLKDAGVIFISIDDNEMAQLKILMDNPDLFGENNFISNIIWRKKRGYGRGDNLVIPQTEYILLYAKDRNKLSFFELPISERKLKDYKYKDSLGLYKRETLEHHTPYGGYVRKTLQYDLIISGKKIFCTTGQWLWSKERVERELKDIIGKNRNGKEYKYLDIIKDSKGRQRAYKKIRLEENGEVRGERPLSIIDDSEITTNSAAHEIRNLFANRAFDFSKPRSLIKLLLKFSSSKNSIILDFMAGTGTTGQAVMELNKEDGGNRQFILCTNNENNICTDVCYPRIKKVIEGYRNLKGEKVEGLGGNLKYFKTDFVDYNEPTDKNKKKLTDEATEMLCIKEGTFEEVLDKKDFKIFKNNSHYTGIIFDQLAIPEFKKEIKNIKGKFSVYVFSLSDETFDEEFTDVKQKIKLSPIPEAILRVYRRIFK